MNVEVHWELTDEQVEDLHELYRTIRWADDRDREGVRRMLDRTDEIVALYHVETDDLVAFGQILTNYEYVAWIYEVIVAAPYRGEGYGAKLMEEMVDHPELQSVEKFQLICRDDYVSFYEQFDFEDISGTFNVMQRKT